MKNLSTPISFDVIDQQARIEDRAFASPSAGYLQNFDAKTILKNPEFLNDLHDVYASKGQFFTSDKEVIDAFFSDKAWEEFNSVSLARGVYESFSADDATKEKMARIQAVYDQFPNFWEEGGRSAFDALSDAVPAAILDPINLIPFGKAAVIGKAAAKAGKSAFWAGAIDGAVKVGAVEAGIGAGFGVGEELRRVETGQTDEVNYGNIALSTILGGGLGGLLGGSIGGVAAKLTGDQTRQIVARKAFLEERLPKLSGKEQADAVTEIGQINQVLDSADPNFVPEERLALPKMEQADAQVQDFRTAQAVEAEDAAMLDELAPSMEDIGDQNLDRLAESIRVEIDQVEKQMGLRPGALGTPDQAAAYKGDADRFSQELFDRYETLQKQLVNISTAKQTKGLADALRTEAQKAADKGNVTKAQELNTKAAQAEANWKFYSTVSDLRELDGRLRADFIAGDEVIPERVATEMQEVAAENAKKQAVVEQNQEFFNRMDEETQTAWNSLDDGSAERAAFLDSVIAQMGEDLAALRNNNLPDQNLGSGKKKTLDVVDGKPVETRFMTEEEVSSVTKKLDDFIKEQAEAQKALRAKEEPKPAAPEQVIPEDPDFKGVKFKKAKKAKPEEPSLVFDEATKGYVSPVKVAGREAEEAEAAPAEAAPAIAEEDIKVKFKRHSYGEYEPIITVKGQRVYLAEDSYSYAISRSIDKDRPKWTYRGTGGSRLDDAKAYIVEEIKRDLLSGDDNFIITGKTDAGTLVDPGPLPEGYVYAIMDGGDTRRAAEYQMMDLADGKYKSPADLLKVMAGRNQGNNWEVGFVPEGTTPNQKDFADVFVKSADDVPGDKSDAIYNFNLSTRDSLPTLQQLNEQNTTVDLGSYLSSGFDGRKRDYPNLAAGNKTAPIAEVVNRIGELENSKVFTKKSKMLRIQEELDRLYKALPAYKLSEQTKASAVDQLIGETGVLSNAAPESVATIRDLLRRVANRDGVLPEFAKGEKSQFVRKADGSSVIELNPKDNSGAHSVGHELFHWMYANILTPDEKSRLNNIVINAIYDADGNLDITKLQEMSPLPLRVGDRVDMDGSLFLELSSGKGKAQQISRNSIEEILASQFNLYLFSELPEQANVFQKIARYISAIIDRFLDGKRLDPDLADRFNRFLPEAAQNKMQGAKPASTTAGKQIEASFDQLYNLRESLEKAMANPGGVGKTRIIEHIQNVAKLANDGDIGGALKDAGMIDIMKLAAADIEDSAAVLGMANRIIDVHDVLEGKLMASFVEAEGAKLAPAWPRGTPNMKGTSKLGREAVLSQIKTSQMRANLKESYDAARASGDRQEMESVFLSIAPDIESYRNFKMFRNMKVRDMNGDAHPVGGRDGYMYDLKNRLYAYGQDPASRDKDAIAQLSDSGYRSEAITLYKEVDKVIEQLHPQFVNITKKNKNAVAKKAAEEVSEAKSTNKTSAKKTLTERKKAEKSDVSVDARLRTLTPEMVDRELLTSSTDKRAADIGAELERREAAQVPEGLEQTPITTRKVYSLIRQEDIEFSGVQIEDGIPNNAPAMVRESIRKITHRDPATQRMARGMMHRLINIADGDQLRLMNVAEVAPDVAYTGEPFNLLRNDLRQLARSIGGTGKTKVQNARSASKKIAELTLRASPPTADRFADIEAAYEFADDALKQGRSASQWFQAHLQNAITGRGGRRPFLGPNAFEANEALETAVESAAYLTNGFIRKGEMKSAMKPLLQYGDVFEGVPSPPSPRRQINERSFVEGGLGADENGKSIAWFHATPNTRPFGSRDFVWEVSRAVDNPRFGPGIYLGRSQENLKNIYAKNPTLAAMARMIDNMVADEDKGFADQIAYALSSARMQINDINMQMTRPENANSKALVEELGLLRDAEEGLVETLSEMGIETMPGVIETRVRAVAPIDIREGTKYSVHHPDMKNMLDVTITNGLVPEERIIDLTNELGDITDGFEGSYLYSRLVDEIADTQQIGEGAAKGELTAALQSLGYDSLRVTEQNRLPEAGVVEHEALVVFDNKNVKSPDAREFNRFAEFFHLEKADDGDTAPVGELATAMMDTGGKPDPNRMGAIIDRMEKGGLAQGAQVIMKKMRGQNLTPEEESILHTANPLRFLQNNANRLRNRHMHWLADWTKPREGAGFHEKEINFLAAKVLPILNGIRSVTGETPFTKWKDTVLSKPWSNKVRQHPAAAAVVKALRRGEDYAVDNLNPEQLALYNKVRSSFDAELQAMNDLGIGVGRITNYVPQIYDIEAIQTHQDEFITIIAEMIRRDRRDNPSNVSSSPADALEVAKSIMLRIVDEEGVYIPEFKMRSSRNGKNPHTDYARVLNLSATNELGQLRYGDILQVLEDRGFLVNNLDGIVSKYFEGTTKKILFQEKFGTGSHGYHDYMAVRGGGGRAAVELLSSNKVAPRDKLAKSDYNSIVGDDVRINDIKGFDEADAQVIVDNIITGIASGTMTVPSIKKLLDMAKPNATQADRVRFEAVANALWEHENFGAIKQSAGDYSDAYFAQIQGRNLEQTQRSRMARQASKAIRNFNSVTLLSYTALTSITDLAIPLLRGARMRDSFNVMRKSLTGDNASEYRAAIANIGAAMESQIHSRMSMLYGSAGGKLTNQFFAANLLAPWTNVQRNIATATGYELLKAQQKIAVKNYNPNSKTQNRAFRNAKRMLSEFGIGEYVTNGKTLDDLSILDAVNGDQNVRMALHRFANETIFTPNKSDIPLFAQGPVGAIVFQLKSYPLMFQRLAGKIVSEAFGKTDGQFNANFVPLVNFLLAGSAMGAGTLTIKDFAQMRGGDDDASFDVRERKLSSILEKMGYDAKIHGPADDFLGWVIEAQMHLGGFGLLADIFYNVAAQADNGLYGATRISSTLLGPSSGTFLDAVQTGQGLYDQALDLSPDSNAKERAAYRMLVSRFPFVGGNRFLREGAADLLGGEDTAKKDKALNYSANYGTKYGTNYGAKY